MNQKIGPIKSMFSSPKGLRFALNIWPPLLFSGIRIKHFGPSFQSVSLKLAKSHLTSNYFGTQFGGSLFSLTDPFWVIMISQNLGPTYTVWDKHGEIEFVKPGRTAVYATLELDLDLLGSLKADADAGNKVLHWFETDLTDPQGEIIAKVRKQVYIRKKPGPSPKSVVDWN